MRAREAFDAIGTRWTLRTPEPLGAGVLARVHACVAAYDAVWSRFRPDSLVARMARTPGVYGLPGHGVALLDLYDVLEERTQGAVTPLVGRSMERLGYDADLSLVPDGPPLPAPRAADVVERDGDRLVVREPVLLDVGAAGKGQLVDLVAAELRACGIEDVLVDAGGDVLRHGAPVRVGLQQPGDATRAVGVVEVGDAAVCASGVDRRAWGDGLHHVVDARTGVPTRDVVATWAVASTAMVADGVATALFFTEPERLQVRLDVEYVRVHADGSARWSLGLPGEVFA